ncbi:unnamed protein product [Cochlearia groenlandica]
MDPSLTLPSNNHVFQPQPQTQTQTQTQHPSIKHPPYSEMISAAITALNEPEGSSMTAISKHIQRFNTDLPLAHRALLFRHLKTLNNSGFLAMVKNSYKLASPPPSPHPPESLAVAATAASDLEALRSEIHELSLDTVAIPSSATQPQKRVRGRPPKPKPQAPGSEQYGPDVTKPVKEAPESDRNESDVAKPVEMVPESEQYGPDVAKPVEEAHELEQYDTTVAKPVEEVPEPVKRRLGRPRKNGAAPTRGRGRPKKKVDSGEIVVAQAGGEIVAVATGMKRGRGRPKRVDSSEIVVAPECGEMVAVATGMKRGRGRPPKNKIGVVISKLVKPKRGGGRPRKALVITGATETQDYGYGEIKRMLDHFQEKAKDIANMLKTGVTSEDQVVVQAIQKLEGLIAMKANEPPPQAMEEVEPEEVALLLTETQGEEHRQEL